MTSDVAGVLPTHSTRRRLSAWLTRSPRTRLALLLSAPLLWLGLAYIGALAALLITALWTTNAFTGDIERVWTLDNFRTVLTDAVYRTVALRTIGVAALVTVIDAVLALPVAFFMAKVARAAGSRCWWRRSSCRCGRRYLVKAYAWRSMFGGGGLIDWLGAPFGCRLPGIRADRPPSCTLAYLWFPYMVLPIFAGLDRLPDSLLEAAGDLGARPGRTLRTVVLPLVFPAVVAGSIFTFSLSLGDYIAVKIVGGTKQFLGNLVYDNIGAANNLPLAAAVGMVPVVVMVVYLFLSGAPARWTTSRWRACSAVAPRGSSCGSSPALILAVDLRAADRRDGQLVQRGPDVRLAAVGVHARPGGRGPLHNAGALAALRHLGAGRAARHRDRAGARHAGRDVAAAVPLLRPRRGVAAGHPADRAARHRHRHRPEQRVPHGPGRPAVGC